MTACTIVIPTHNRPDLLPRAVGSALLACPADGEVLVVDDCSEIPAVQVLADLTDSRVKVIRNASANGAAQARNQGVLAAVGAVVFFLDDDDEMVSDYCDRILSTGGGASQAHWGFSSTVIRAKDSLPADSPLIRHRLRRGPVPNTSRVRDRIAAMSEGFWIKKRCFEDAGGLDPDLTIDEDTDLCIRLMGLDISPWYEIDPGMVVYRGYMPAAGSAGQLTVATPVSQGLRCYRRTFDKNEASFATHSAPRWFLASRFVRRAVNQEQSALAQDFVSGLKPNLFQMGVASFLRFKTLVHRWRFLPEQS
jgi:glycosyltransferase involved in cell wall biosynthesis